MVVVCRACVGFKLKGELGESEGGCLGRCGCVGLAGRLGETYDDDNEPGMIVRRDVSIEIFSVPFVQALFPNASDTVHYKIIDLLFLFARWLFLETAKSDRAARTTGAPGGILMFADKGITTPRLACI